MTTRTDEELGKLWLAAETHADGYRAIYDLGYEDGVDAATAACESHDDERLRLAWQWCIVATAERGDEQRRLTEIRQLWTRTMAAEDEAMRLRADVERLTRERDEARKTRDQDHESFQIWRNDCARKVEAMQKERDEARAALDIACSSSTRTNAIRDAIYAAEYVRQRERGRELVAHREAAHIADKWAEQMRGEQKADPDQPSPGTMPADEWERYTPPMGEQRAKVGPWVDEGVFSRRYYEDDRSDPGRMAAEVTDSWWSAHEDGDCGRIIGHGRIDGPQANRDAADAALRERGLL